MHVGGDVRLDERTAAGTVALGVVAARHLLDQHAPARSQVAVNRLGEHDVLLVADMFAHLDRRDRVDPVVGHARLAQVAKVSQADLHPICQPTFGGLLHDVVALL